MVLGIDSFREKFKDYTDYYTIIGGTDFYAGTFHGVID